ncbi:zinc-dependent alcohol dehydrogenase family protein [Thiobacter aerophilum]|uniref:Zinc-dependent alcohol dehydrogenase family protein n=1 Tax=Thiobacter aerophilum TaxID=3121275 RepID=A0ABV0EBJ8_9BURK
MKAILMTAPGGPETLELADIPMPELPGPDYVRVKLHAAGVNPVDTKLRKTAAYYPDRLPCVLGCDGAGVVERVGANVHRFTPGDEVYFFNGGLGAEQGNYAEYTVVHQDYVAFKPRHVTMEEAAALPLVLITAWESLVDRTCLAEGQSVLIHAGAGGVGHIAIQLAKQIGATVITTVGTPEKAAWVTHLGAERVVAYRDADFVQAVLDWTHGRGVDVVLDTVGGANLCRSFSCTRVYGRVVTLLQMDCPAEAIRLARLRNLALVQELMLTPTLLNLHEQRVHQRRILEEGARLVEADKLKVKVSHVLPLEEATRAHRMIEEGHTTGKIVLRIV